MTAQRQDRDEGLVEQVVQVRAKPPLFYRVFEIVLSHGDYPDINRDAVITATSLNAGLLQDAQQLGLRARTELADLVEKKRTVIGLLETPNAPRVGAREGASLVSEKFALEGGLWQPRAIHFNKGLPGPFAMLMNGVGD